MSTAHLSRFSKALITHKADQNNQRAQVLKARTSVAKGEEEKDGAGNSSVSNCRITPHSRYKAIATNSDSRISEY